MPAESTSERQLVAQQLLREASLELARLRRVRGAYRTTWRRIARARKRLALAAALLAAPAMLAELAASGVPVLQHGFVFPDLVSGVTLYPSANLADVDGDGDLDALVSGEQGTTSLLANTGTPQHPHFEAPAVNPFGLNDVGNHAVATFADIDGDGDLDAFIGEQFGSVFFFRNTGTAAAPAFATRLTNPFGLADVGYFSAPTAADLDGDGDLDLAVGTSSGDTLFFRNTGTAGATAFVAPLTNPFGLADVGELARPTFADLDGDGDLDAVIGENVNFGSGRPLAFFENTGSPASPTFAPPTPTPFGLRNFGAWQSVAFGDVDQDGDLDALSSAALLMIALDNTGTASAPAFALAGDPFGLSLPLSITSAIWGSAPSFGDVDTDGDADALVGIFFGSLAFSRNTGGPSLPAFARDPGNPYGLVGKDPSLADIDADGDVDAFVGSGSGDTTFFENTGSANFPAFAAAATNPFGLSGVGAYAAPELADLDGDGDLDALVGGSDGSTRFFENTGTAALPAFAPPALDPFGLANVGFVASPSLADIDSDGDLDAFLGEFAGNVVFFRNTGTASAPAFAAPAVNPFGLFDIGSHTAPTFADQDGDGDLDAFVGRASYPTALFVNTGTSSAPAFVGQGFDPFGNDGSFTAPALADLDGDGDLDVLVGRFSDPSLLLVRNLGTPSTPSFVAADAVNPFGLPAGQPQLADIDADGDLDVFLGLFDGNTRFVRNTGSVSEAAFAAPVTNPFGLVDVGDRATPTLADPDADGDLDALVGNSLGHTLWFQNTGTAATPAFAAASTNPFGLADVGATASPALADLDLDGDLDAFIGNGDGNTLFFANVGSANAPAFAAPSTNPFGLTDVGRYASPAFVDIDGDGDLDGFVGESRGRVFFFETVSIDVGPCEDGVDNDGDGRIDAGSDAGCTNSFDTSELSTLQCDNGLDDDADGKIDWRGDGSGDPHCSGLLDDRELPPPPAGPGCGLGPELLLLVPLLEAERRRRTSRSKPPPC